MTRLIKDPNTGSYALPETLTQGQSFTDPAGRTGIVNFDVNTGKRLAKGATTYSRPLGSVPIGGNTGTGTPPPATNMTVTDILQKILKDFQTGAANQYKGNTAALLQGKEKIAKENADLYSQDLANANLSNDARLSILNNDNDVQDPGLRSIENQQQMNEARYKSSNDLIQAANDAYNKEQDRIARAASELADAKYKADMLAETIRSNKADEAYKRSNPSGGGFNAETTIPEFTKNFESIKGLANANSKGGDNYVDPQEWIAARTLWGIRGGSDASFVSNFKKYLNPLSYSVAGIKDSGQEIDFSSIK